MAKLKGPLLSLGASGAIADTLVYFPWKGLNAVRQYVVPSNPNTPAQATQRGYLHTAVDKIHEAMAHLVVPLTDTDKSAWALLGSLMATPRTWFNTCVKMAVVQQRNTKGWTPWSSGVVTPGVDQLTFALQMPAVIAPATTDGFIWYGTSKSAMLSSLATTVAALAAGKVITPLVTGVKYYLQFRSSAPAGAIGADSGIYYGVPT